MGKSPRSIGPMEKISASILLKLFIDGNKRCHTTDATERMSGTLVSNVSSIQSMIQNGHKNITTQICRK